MKKRRTTSLKRGSYNLLSFKKIYIQDWTLWNAMHSGSVLLGRLNYLCGLLSQIKVMHVSATALDVCTTNTEQYWATVCTTRSSVSCSY